MRHGARAKIWRAGHVFKVVAFIHRINSVVFCRNFYKRMKFEKGRAAGGKPTYLQPQSCNLTDDPHSKQVKEIGQDREEALLIRTL